MYSTTGQELRGWCWCHRNVSAARDSSLKGNVSGSAGANVSGFVDTGATCWRQMSSSKMVRSQTFVGTARAHRFVVDPTNLWTQKALSTACSDPRVACCDPAPVIHIMRALGRISPRGSTNSLDCPKAIRPSGVRVAASSRWQPDLTVQLRQPDPGLQVATPA